MKINQYESAVRLAEAIRRQEVTAKAIVLETLEQIAALNPILNCFTTVTEAAAITQAEVIDRAIASGDDPGTLAGVPFAVKDLFDIKGVTTLAGSKINAENSPAIQDAAAIATLKQAGAICVGALNMDEYAYGFSTENTHYGTTRNPHALDRVAGGSSGGSAVAVAAGLVPLTLGSDTNGSIRVPASLCGVFGFKPTYGRLSRSGAVLFSESLDHIRPFARSIQDVALAFDLLQQVGGNDPVHTDLSEIPARGRAPELCLPELDQGIDGLRIAIADGYFAEGALPEAIAAVQQVAKALNVTRTVSLPESHRARAAALTITACEGAQRHLHNLRTRPQDFDPRTRDRFLSGAFLPASWYIQAQQFRQWYRDQVRQIFQEVDLILAPTTPYYAPLIEQNLIEINGAKLPSRPNLGRFTQPLSFIGLPILSVPVSQTGSLPIGVQLVAAPYQESVILRVAAALEANGVVKATIASVKP